MAVQQRGGVMHDHDATPPSFGDVIEPGCWGKMEVLKAAVNIGTIQNSAKLYIGVIQSVICGRI